MGDYIYYEAGYLKQVEDDMFVRILTVGVLLGIIVVLVVAFVLKKSFRLAKEITDPIASLSENVRKVGYGDFRIQSVETNVIEVKNLNQGVQKMARRIETLLQNVQEEERKQHMIQLELLQAQVSPHFLYNTLDTIVWMVEADMHDEAIEMLTHLSVFFRTVLSKGEDVISLGDEVLHTRSYLEIQQMRYQDILQYEICVPEELNHCQIPKITLQPLVENAIFHGIEPKGCAGHIRIHVGYETSDNTEKIRIDVTDDGVGMTADKAAQVLRSNDDSSADFFREIGVSNVHKRLQYQFGAEYGITIESKEGEYTTMSIHIPNIPLHNNETVSSETISSENT